MDIEKISRDINEQLQNYEIGEIQQFRQNVKKLSRPKSYSLFPSKPINKNWTFHIGGRNELQFNIANEEEGLRFGFAFSLNPNISLPNPEILYPKIRKLNYIIQTKPYLFEYYKMWTLKNGERSDIHDVKPIMEQDISVGNFIFIGKIQEVYNLSEIMNAFDALFPIYKEVESDISIENQGKIGQENEFVFKKAERRLPKARHLTTIKKELDVSIRHSLIQEELIVKLNNQYGEDNVASEHYIGQLLDYCCYPSQKNATKIFVVG